MDVHDVLLRAPACASAHALGNIEILLQRYESVLGRLPRASEA